MRAFVGFLVGALCLGVIRSSWLRKSAEWHAEQERIRKMAESAARSHALREKIARLRNRR